MTTAFHAHGNLKKSPLLMTVGLADVAMKGTLKTNDYSSCKEGGLLAAELQAAVDLMALILVP